MKDHKRFEIKKQIGYTNTNFAEQFCILYSRQKGYSLYF